MLKAASQQTIASVSGNMKNLSVAQETATGNTQSPRYTPDRDPLAFNPLLRVKRKQILPLPERHSIHSVFAGTTTQRDLNRMVSQYFAIGCDKYYQRCSLLEELIESQSPVDELFMAALNSGPMYSTDCCRFVQTYVNKFSKHLLMKDTVLSDLEKIINESCPPMDIPVFVSLVHNL